MREYEVAPYDDAEDDAQAAAAAMNVVESKHTLFPVDVHQQMMTSSDAATIRFRHDHSVEYMHMAKRGKVAEAEEAKPILQQHGYAYGRSGVDATARESGGEDEMAAALWAAARQGGEGFWREEEEEAGALLQLRARIASHPLFPQLLEAHLACLHALPPLPPPPSSSSSSAPPPPTAAQLLLPLRHHYQHIPLPTPHQLHLDHFMVSFVRLLQSFQEQLREQANVYCVDAMAAVSEIANAFAHLTGEEIPTAATAEGAAAASGGMTDDEMMEEEDYLNVDANENVGNYYSYEYVTNATGMQSAYTGEADGNLMMNVNVDGDRTNYYNVGDMFRRHPQQQQQQLLHHNLINSNDDVINAANYNSLNSPSADMVDRTLMHHVRKELKLELKQNYRSKLTEVRDEILRKRRAAGGRQPKGQNVRDQREL